MDILQRPSGLFRGSDAIRESRLTPHRLAGDRYRRVLHNVYLEAGLPLDHRTKCRAAALIAPATAVLTGRSAAAVRGLALADAEDPVEFVVTAVKGFRQARELRVRRTALAPGDSEPWAGIRLATPRRMTLDLLLRHSPRTGSQSWCLSSAVADLDRVLSAGLVTAEEVAATLHGRHDRGIALAREAFDLRDPRAESRRESQWRVMLTLAGLPPEPQFTVDLQDGRRARLGLAYPAQRIAVEFDRLDASRRNRLRALGWRLLAVTPGDLSDDARRIVEELRALLSQSALLSRTSRCGVRSRTEGGR